MLQRAARRAECGQELSHPTPPPTPPKPRLCAGTGKPHENDGRAGIPGLAKAVSTRAHTWTTIRQQKVWSRAQPLEGDSALGRGCVNTCLRMGATKPRHICLYLLTRKPFASEDATPVECSSRSYMQCRLCPVSRGVYAQMIAQLPAEEPCEQGR